MIVSVSLAVLEQGGRWLVQLRDDCEGIVAPGSWGLFGGHLEAGESAEQALRRELVEEIGFRAGALQLWYRSAAGGRIRHLFRVPLTVPLAELELREGQDMALATLAELRSGRVWSPRLAQHRGLAPSLREALEREPAGS